MTKVSAGNVVFREPITQYIPPEPSNAQPGEAFVIVRGESGWTYAPIETPAPADLFVPGWSFLPFSGIPELLQAGNIHAAVNIGAQQPTINGASFEQSATNTADIDVPAAGWSGATWKIDRASAAPTPPSIGSNAARLESSAFADLPDPSFGTIPGAQDLCIASLRRNSYVTISGLTAGDRYYYAAIFATRPDSRTRACRIEPSDGGPAVVFGVDGVDSILQKAVRRYGFTAQGSDISFLKYGPDSNGAYQTGFIVLNMGAAT